MESIELLKHWKKFVDLAIQETYLAFKQNHGLFLTEGDVKCYLFNELRKNIKIQPYTVHAEVTHYANYNEYGFLRFRDLALLNPERLINNANPIPQEDGIRNKGYSHIGESIFFEIKFQRNENIRINPEDLQDLINYQYEGNNCHKYAILVWASKHEFYDNNPPEEMVEALTYFSENVGQVHIPFDHVFGFVFNHEELWEVKYQNDKWKSLQIAP